MKIPVIIMACIGLVGLASAQVITVTPETRQTIKGWGVFGGYHRTSDWGPNFGLVARPGVPGSSTKTNILDALWNELGVTMGRVDLAPTYYDPAAPDTVNKDKIGDLVAHLQAARDRGVPQYKITVWSPPASMKSPARVEGHYWRLVGDGTNRVNFFNGIASDPRYERVTTSLRPDKESDFVSYYAKAVKYLTTQGLDAPVVVSLQNEPRWDPFYDACTYSAAQYHRVAIALRAAFDAEGLTGVKMIAAEHNDYGDGKWGNPIFYKGWSALRLQGGLPNALAAAFDGIAVHSYDLTKGAAWEKGLTGEPGQPSDKDLYLNEYTSSLTRLSRDFPDWEFWATEHSIDYNSGLDEMGLTMRAICQFNREIATIPHHYWFWWQGYNSGDPNGHLQALLLGDNDNLIRTKLFHVFSRLWNAVPPGSVVRKVTSDSPAFVSQDGAFEVDTVAFEKADGHVVLLVCNAGTSAQSVNLAGLTSPMATVHLSTPTLDMVAQESLNVTAGIAGFTMPPASIAIFECGISGVDEITGFTVPARVSSGSGTATVTLETRTAGADRSFWVEIYGNNSLKGSVKAGIVSNSQEIQIPYSGLLEGPVSYWVSLGRVASDISFDTATASSAISLYQGWAQPYFMNLPGGVGHPLAAFDADYDGDGLANGVEYALGTAPNLATDGPAITVGVFTFPVVHPFPADLSVFIEGSDLINGWLTIASRVPGLVWDGPVTEVTEGDQRRINLLLSNEPSHFYRLRTVQP